MNLAFSIALSHLLSHRRQTLVSLLGITLGVAFFMAVTSLMQGSDADFIKRLVDGSPHVTVYDEYRNPRPQPVFQTYADATVELRSLKPRTEVRGIRQYKEKIEFISSLPHVRVAPVLVGQAIVTFAGKDLGATINGVVPDMMKRVSTIDEHFIAGSLDTLAANPDGIVLGSGLAEKFRVGMGKNVTVASPVGVVRTMKVVGLFRTGNAPVDESQAYVLLKRNQNLLNRPNIANRFILQLDDPDQAPEVAKVVEAGVGYKAQSWQEASQDLMSLLKVRRIIMNSVVGAILIVASFGIYNVISTVVLEKTRDIAIMKSVGFHARSILLIFLIEGAIVGAIGSVFGTAFGLAMMEALATVQIKTPFNTEPTYIPLDWGWSPIAMGVGFAMTSALAAAYLPARKGASVHPVDILGRRMSAVLRTEGLTRVLPGDVPVTLVEDITLEIEQGEFVAIMGPSGSGKSSLLYLLGLLDMPTGGKIWLNGKDTQGLSEDELANIRLSQLGFVFQFHFLLAEFSALDNVLLPIRRLGLLSEHEAQARGLELLGSLGLGDQARKLPGQMSGGQRQRVAVARALANDPVILFADEPTGALDTKSSENLRGIFKDLSHRQKRTVVAVTHDPSFAKAADRVLFLVDGKLQPPERAAELFAVSIR